MDGVENNPALLGLGGPLGVPAPTAKPGSGKDASDQTGATGQTAGRGPSFASVLADRTAPAGAPNFSKHALDRLARRGIDLDGQTLGRLTEGIQRAADKGARNSVVFVDGTAFVASVQNNTVITAVSQEHMRSHVFTNIDSAVIA